MCVSMEQQSKRANKNKLICFKVVNSENIHPRILPLVQYLFFNEGFGKFERKFAFAFEENSHSRPLTSLNQFKKLKVIFNQYRCVEMKADRLYMNISRIPTKLSFVENNSDVILLE